MRVLGSRQVKEYWGIALTSFCVAALDISTGCTSFVEPIWATPNLVAHPRFLHHCISGTLDLSPGHARFATVNPPTSPMQEDADVERMRRQYTELERVLQSLKGAQKAGENVRWSLTSRGALTVVRHVAYGVRVLGFVHQEEIHRICC